MKINTSNTAVGFIGTGVMGKSMAAHILRAGYPVVVYNRTAAKTADLVSMGAQAAADVAALATQCNVIITMVGYPSDVEEIYLGERGILQFAKAGSYLLDMTTSTPSLARRISQAAGTKGIHALDAPVSGGDIGAREGRLTIMVGGEQDDFDAVLPVLALMGRNIIRQGPAGAGQHTKMCNQIAIAGNMVGVCEAMAYAQKAGLDPDNVLKSIEAGAAGSWSLSNLAPRMLAGNFAPGFFVKHFIKDMTIALEAAREMGLLTPGLALVKSLYEQLAAQGEENSGTQALFKLYLTK
ncbi:Hypothetical protein LUCI_0535 [Lucifera butyrica]|uniref:3-hydroxyisobutyrate dehydrogenase signature n=1 Tax=Lucifera butyrica TaxID=1351585 RepID=A0A498R862_9FIRM|nr:NAD(P)-dependent oxidoreductase [Lucifera butyrica]VBB05328.1 Hypothetical protein LUCI_0535 [Lucifera butyrica]